MPFFPSISVNLGYLMGLRLCQNFEANTTSGQEALALSLESEADQHGVGILLRSQRTRRRVKFDEESMQSASMSNFGSSDTSKKGTGILRHGKPIELPLRKDFMAPWDSYIKECIRSMLEDISSTLNFKVFGCCHQHANLSLLLEWMNEMQSIPCSSGPDLFGAWQCKECSAIISAREDDSLCWICTYPKG